MPTVQEWLPLAASLGAGLTAGVCFAFASFLMPAFERLGAPHAIRTMQSINRVILGSTAIMLWFATVPLGIAAAVFAHDTIVATTAASLYFLGAVLVTGRGNVPLNEALDEASPEQPDAASVWRNYRIHWDRWNTVRTTLLAIAALGFALAA